MDQTESLRHQQTSTHHRTLQPLVAPGGGVLHLSDLLPGAGQGGGGVGARGLAGGEARHHSGALAGDGVQLR